MIPPWIAKLLEQAKADSWTGTIAIVFRGGEARHAKREDVLYPPEVTPVKGAVLKPVCPNGCGPMSDQDYGNLYVCTKCGTKRTRSQLRA